MSKICRSEPVFGALEWSFCASATEQIHRKGRLMAKLLPIQEKIMKCGGVVGLTLCLLIALAACGTSYAVNLPTVTATSATQEAVRITPIAITETVTPASAENPGPCANMWATELLPAESAKIQELFDQAGMTDYQVKANAFGENCVAEDGSIVSFGASETDIYVTVTVLDLQDRNDLGAHLYALMQILEQINFELSGPNVGYLGVTFQQGGQSVQLWAPRDAVAQAILNGLRGSDLFDALQSH